MERTTSSPERTAQQNAERALLETNVEDLRGRQQDILHNTELSEDERRTQLDESVHTYLGDYQVDRSDDHYDEYYAILRSLSADAMSHIEWHYGDWDREAQVTSGKTGFDKLRDAQENLFGRRLDFEVDVEDSGEPEDPEVPEPELDAATRELLEALNAARDKWSTISAKRQGRVRGVGVMDRKATEADYQEAVRAYVRHELADLLADADQTDEFKNVAVIQHLFNEQELLRDQTRAKLKDSKVNKFVEFMNKGSLPTRIAKGVGVGAAAGFLGTVLAGAAGAGVIAGTVIGFSRFAKGYAVHSKDKVGTKSFEDVADSDRLQQWHDENGEHDHLDVTADYFDESFDDDTKAEQNKRLKSFAVGAGSVAVGAAAGYGLGRATELSGKAIDAVKGWYDDSGIKALNPDSLNAPDLDGDGIPDADDHDIDGDGVNNGPDDAPRDPNVTTIPGPEGLDWSDFDRDARFVEHGEGGFQTLEEMGVPQEKWEAIWQDAGTVFNEQGKTYVMDDGRWGWDHTMRMSDADLTVLAEAAERNGVTL